MRKILTWQKVLVVVLGSGAIWVLLGTANGPEQGECLKQLACINERFFKEADRLCPADGKCQFSMKETAGDVDHAYFIEEGSISINECKTFRVPEGLRQTYSPWCKYILFEKGGEITGYVRAGCTLDVQRLPIREGERDVSFDIHDGADFASVMDARRPLAFQRLGRDYFVKFSRQDIHPLKGEPCIGNVFNAP